MARRVETLIPTIRVSAIAVHVGLLPTMAVARVVAHLDLHRPQVGAF